MSVSPLAKDDAPTRPKAYALLDDPRVLGWGSIILVLVVWELFARLFVGDGCPQKLHVGVSQQVANRPPLPCQQFEHFQIAAHPFVAGQQ